MPWLGKLLLGTTDTPRDEIETESVSLTEEVGFILGEAGRCLARKPSAGDVRSIWGGVRPLVKPPAGRAGSTKDMSREHLIVVDESGLVTVTGGKRTTYRAMAEAVIERCIGAGLIESAELCRTTEPPLDGAPATVGHRITDPPGAHLFRNRGRAPGRFAWARTRNGHGFDGGDGPLCCPI